MMEGKDHLNPQWTRIISQTACTLTKQTLGNLGNALATKMVPKNWLESFSPKSSTCSLFSHTLSCPLLGLDADHEISQLFSYASSKEDWSLCEYHLWMEGSGEQINKIMISTQLSQADKPKEIPILEFCKDFTDIFSEKTYNVLPPH